MSLLLERSDGLESVRGFTEPVRWLFASAPIRLPRRLHHNWPFAYRRPCTSALQVFETASCVFDNPEYSS